VQTESAMLLLPALTAPPKAKVTAYALDAGSARVAPWSGLRRKV